MITGKKERWNIDRNRMRNVSNNVLLHIHPTRIPAAALSFTYTWGLGGIATLLALVLLITGALLVFRYEPTVSGAYLSILALETTVPFGSLIRSLHHWSANLLLVVSFLHLLRVVFTAGYKAGRKSNYIIGVLLFLIILAFNFTGYLLPWDQLAYWAITVGTSLLGYIPLIGVQLQTFFVAGPEIGQEALSNSYSIHVAFLPAIMLTMTLYHFWKIRKNGGLTFPGIGLIEKGKEYERVKRVTTIPNLIQIEVTAAVIVLVALITFAMIVPAPLENIANPKQSPNPAKAAWYFAGIQEFLLHMHPESAMTLIAILLAALILLPVLDTKIQDTGKYFRSRIGKKTALFGALFGLDVVPLLIILDEFFIDFDSWMPGLSTRISGGLIPLGFTLLGLAALYIGMRRGLQANRSEAALGLFTFIATGLVILTVIGSLFRGPNMALYIPYF